MLCGEHGESNKKPPERGTESIKTNPKGATPTSDGGKIPFKPQPHQLEKSWHKSLTEEPSRRRTFS